MPSFKSRGGRNYARKSRRVAKYGKYNRPSGATRAIVRGRAGRFTSIYRPKFNNPFRKDFELVQLKYRQVVSIDPTSDLLSTGGSGQPTWAFSFNGLFDTDITGFGNQPMYFDNYSQLYQRYRVSFSKIKATVVNHTVNTATANSSGSYTGQPNYSYKLAIVRDYDNDAGTSMENLLMQNATNCRWRYVAPQLNGKLPSLSMKCAPHKTAGVSYEDDTLSSLTNANPSRNIKGTICVTSADGISDPPSVRVVVEMTFYVKFFDRVVNQAPN